MTGFSIAGLISLIIWGSENHSMGLPLIAVDPALTEFIVLPVLFVKSGKQSVFALPGNVSGCRVDRLLDAVEFLVNTRNVLMENVMALVPVKAEEILRSSWISFNSLRLSGRAGSS